MHCYLFLKKEITVHVMGKKTGIVTKSYILHKAWPSDVEVTDLDSQTSGIVYERIAVEFDTFDVINEQKKVTHSL